MPVVFLLLRPNKVAVSGPGQPRYHIVLPAKGDEDRRELSLVTVGTWECLVWELKHMGGPSPFPHPPADAVWAALFARESPTHRSPFTIQKVLKHLCHAGAVPASQ